MVEFFTNLLAMGNYHIASHVKLQVETNRMAVNEREREQMGHIL